MKIRVFENKEELSIEAARFISSRFLSYDSFNLGVATGKNLTSIHEVLTETLWSAHRTDFRSVVVATDEKCPMSQDDAGTLSTYFMR